MYIQNQSEILRRRAWAKSVAIVLLSLASMHLNTSFAEPTEPSEQAIVIEGVVANIAAKDSLLKQLKTIYPTSPVIDRIQVRAVATPEGWTESVNQLIRPELKNVEKGRLDVNGTTVLLTGALRDPSQMSHVQTVYQGLVQTPYQLNIQLSGLQAEQQVIDDTLKNRIVEFESGSAILTASGLKILDEMAAAMNKVQGKNIKIVGHTDNVGQAQSNLKLSQQRAEAVKNYLISKNIAAVRLSLEGKGAQQPVADNSTAEGRQKNRRIEFIVL